MSKLQQRVLVSMRKEEFQFKKDKPPACVVDIFKWWLEKDGDRNQATVQLACYFKDAGYTREKKQ